MKSKGVQDLLNYPKGFKFGVVLYDFTCGPCLLGLMEHFDYPPIIATTALGNPPALYSVVGGHKYPAYVPYYRLDYDIDMNFFERVYNVAIHVFHI